MKEALNAVVDGKGRVYFSFRTFAQSNLASSEFWIGFCSFVREQDLTLECDFLACFVAPLTCFCRSDGSPQIWLAQWL